MKNNIYRYAANGRLNEEPSWAGVADNLVCQSLGAAAIRDELTGLLPDNLWFVSVQPASGSWANGATT